MKPALTALLLAALASSALPASAERARWVAADAFEAAGILESYLPADGREWIVADGITLSFWRSDGDNPPLILLNPQSAMLLSAGNTLEVLADEGLEIRQVRIRCTDEFEAPQLQATPLPADEYVLTLLPHPDAEAGRMNRAAITAVDITYGEADAIKEINADPAATSTRPALYDLQGRPLAAPPRRGLYIANGRLRLNK